MGRAREPKNPKSCHERALGLLAVRPRSVQEVRARLLRAGFDTVEVEEVIGRLEHAGLLDDEQFARDLAEQAFKVKRAGPRAVSSALLAKGVSRDLVDAVSEDYRTGEPERLADLAASRAARLGRLDPPTAQRRLVSFLIRRGHDPADAREAAARALGLGH